MRCADFCPIPGRRLNSVISRASGSGRNPTLKQAGRQAEASEHPAHFALRFFIDFFHGVVAGGKNQILQHFHIARDFLIDFYPEEILVAVHFHSDHAPAGRPFDANGGDLSLHFLLHLLRLLHHSLHISRHFHSFLGLLQIAYCADFAAKHFSKPLHFGMRQRASGDFIFRRGLGDDGLLNCNRLHFSEARL